MNYTLHKHEADGEWGASLEDASFYHNGDSLELCIFHGSKWADLMQGNIGMENGKLIIPLMLHQPVPTLPPNPSPKKVEYVNLLLSPSNQEEDNFFARASNITYWGAGADDANAARAFAEPNDGRIFIFLSFVNKK